MKKVINILKIVILWLAALCSAFIICYGIAAIIEYESASSFLDTLLALLLLLVLILIHNVICRVIVNIFVSEIKHKILSTIILYCVNVLFILCICIPEFKHLDELYTAIIVCILLCLLFANYTHSLITVCRKWRRVE
jgi:hypothetical protein